MCSSCLYSLYDDKNYLKLKKIQLQDVVQSRIFLKHMVASSPPRHLPSLLPSTRRRQCSQPSRLKGDLFQKQHQRQPSLDYRVYAYRGPNIYLGPGYLNLKFLFANYYLNLLFI